MKLRTGILVSIALIGTIALAGPAAQQAKKSVSIKDMRFSPADIEVRVGDTVTWTNSDDRDHTVTADDGSFKSDNLSSGNRFSYKFTKAGRFSYCCSYHPRMKGSVTVSE